MEYYEKHWKGYIIEYYENHKPLTNVCDPTQKMQNVME